MHLGDPGEQRSRSLSLRVRFVSVASPYRLRLRDGVSIREEIVQCEETIEEAGQFKVWVQKQKVFA